MRAIGGMSRTAPHTEPVLPAAEERQPTFGDCLSDYVLGHRCFRALVTYVAKFETESKVLVGDKRVIFGYLKRRLQWAES